MKKTYDLLMTIISMTILIITVCSIINSGNIANAAQPSNDENTIIPKPLSFEKNEGEFIISKDTVIYVKGRTKEENEEIIKIAQYINDKLSVSGGFQLKILEGDNAPDNSIFLTTLNSEETQGDEGYNLITTSKKVDVIGYKPQGIFRGIQSLIALLPAEIESKKVVENVKWSIPACMIKDKPEYEHRGFMIDVARRFFSVDDIKRQIDIASQYKINRLHLHLSDDQGWRLEIKKYPDLTIIGGSTEVGGGPGGYYTQEQFKDIVKYASDRYIEIIPEFDMPGHCNAALASYGFLNPDGKRKPLYTGTAVGFSTFMTHDERTYEFIEDVIKETAAISPSKYFHIGGDEAQSTPKADYDYFVGRVSKIAEKYNKIPIGWDPIDTSPEIGSNVVLQNWKDSNEEAVKKKMKIIISIAKKTYLDMKYNKDTPYGTDWAGYIDVKTAYDFDLTDYAPKNLILGIEAPLWTEFIPNTEAMDYMIYPRLLGYAEIGWTPKSSRNWDEYKNRLKKAEERLTIKGVNYYKGIDASTAKKSSGGIFKLCAKILKIN